MYLIDGDTLAYAAAFKAPDPEFDLVQNAYDHLDDKLANIFEKCPGDYQIYLTGKGNYRIDIAKAAPYKGNRKADKPVYLEHVKEYMICEYDAIMVHGFEADDAIGIHADRLGYDCTVVGIDKDFMQFPCQHYNPRTQEWCVVSEWEGLYFVYKQMLTGDTTDNIKGAFRVGPVKADKLLAGAKTEEELWAKVVEGFQGDEELALENARLVWLQRYENQLWTPPGQPDKLVSQ